MKKIKTIAMAAALVAGVSTMALAQSGMGTSGSMSQPSGSTEQNAKASGGPGTHVGAPKTGTAESNAKVLHNQNGYKGKQQ
jgi:hypothetical protein